MTRIVLEDYISDTLPAPPSQTSGTGVLFYGLMFAVAAAVGQMLASGLTVSRFGPAQDRPSATGFHAPALESTGRAHLATAAVSTAPTKVTLPLTRTGRADPNLATPGGTAKHGHGYLTLSLPILGRGR